MYYLRKVMFLWCYFIVIFNVKFWYRSLTLDTLRATNRPRPPPQTLSAQRRRDKRWTRDLFIFTNHETRS